MPVEDEHASPRNGAAACATEADGSTGFGDRVDVVNVPYVPIRGTR
mgnify:CR=1 FL=1